MVLLASSKMKSLSGFVIVGIIFLSVVEGTIAENNCSRCASNKPRHVCKGDSTILDVKDLVVPSIDASRIIVKTVKLCNTMTDGKDIFKGNSSKIELKNIGENDTGTYKFRLSGSNNYGLKLSYCAKLKISCEHLTVPSGSSVNLTCKVSEDGAKLKNTVNWYYKSESMAIGKKLLATVDIRTHIAYTLSQLKKSDSGNYTCSRENMDHGASKKHYIYVLKVYEPQLITTTKETPSQTGKRSSEFSSLPAVVSTLMMRKETLDPTLKTEEAVPFTGRTGDSAVVNRVKGEKTTIPNSTGARANSALCVLVLSQSYIWIWKMWYHY